jgi:dTMP kinase
MKGKFIVFEGVEGSGKTTQIARLYSWLASSEWSCYPTISTRQPGGTAIGVAIRRLLLEEDESPLHDRAELMLYAADRAQHIEEIIKPHLDMGGLVLCDRYTDSTVAYQGYGRGLDRGLIENINDLATAGLESDLTIWLDVDVEVGLERARQRGQFDRMEKTAIEFHRRVQQGYQELSSAFPQRIVRVEASGDEDAIHQEIKKAVTVFLQRTMNPISLQRELLRSGGMLSSALRNSV